MSFEKTTYGAKETLDTPDVLQQHFTKLSLEGNVAASSVPFPNFSFESERSDLGGAFAGVPESAEGHNGIVGRGKEALKTETSGSSLKGLLTFHPDQVHTITENWANLQLSPYSKMRSEGKQPMPNDLLSPAVCENHLQSEHTNKVRDQRFSHHQGTSRGRPGESRNNKGRKISKPQRVAPETSRPPPLECYAARRHPSPPGVENSNARLPRIVCHHLDSRLPRSIADSQVVPGGLQSPNQIYMYQRQMQARFNRRLMNQNSGPREASMMPILVRTGSGGSSDENKIDLQEKRRRLFLKYSNH